MNTVIRFMMARLRKDFPRAAALIEPHLDMLRKAVSFALIGVVNVGVDTSMLFLARFCINSSGAALRLFDTLALWLMQWLPFATSGGKLVLVAANVIAWVVAVSGSYVMNTSITFAAESGRQLLWRDYRRFAASGILGLIANTAVLYVVSDVMPLLAAKGCAILAAFTVNFFMSHFVVFRPRRATSEGALGVTATD